MKSKNAIICTLLILVSLCFIGYNFMTPPKPMRERPASMPPAAGVYQVETGSIPIYIETVATLISFQNITLKSKVSGEIEYLSEEFEIGSIVKKGTVLLTVEKRDYENEVKKLFTAKNGTENLNKL